MVDRVSTPTDNQSLRPGPIAARIGERVRSWRQEAGIAEADLAAALQMPVDIVREAEAGTTSFSAAQLVILCELYAVRPSRFLENLL